MMNDHTIQKNYFSKANSDVVHICIITLIWILIVTLVNPIGNFPFEDDWAYGWTVKTLLETGQFQLSDWTATNLLPQALWGTLFCLPFGFSFTALRFSTLSLGLLGIIATYGLFRETGADAKLSLLGTLVVALNPIYFGLSHSFNSDIPSFTFCILAVYFLVRGTRLNSKTWMIAGLVFSFIAILNRQSSFIVLPAFGIAYLVRQKLSLKNFTQAFLPTLFGVIVYVAYSHWLSRTGRTPLLYGLQIRKLMETLSGGPNAIVLTYLENICLFAIYLGLFLFPLLVFQFSQLFKTFSKRQRRINFGLTLFLIAIGVVLILKREQMPLIGNTLDTLGLGPVSIEGHNAFLKENISLRTLIRIGWALLTLIGLTGVSMLLQYAWTAAHTLMHHRGKFSQAWLLIFLLTASLLYFLPIGGITKGYWFDRYLILLLPLSIASILIVTRYCSDQGNFNPKMFLFVCTMLVCLGAFTISATHDYLLWNRVRWFALDNLMQSAQVSPGQIGGGMEFNGWYFGHKIETCNPKFQRNAQPASGGWEDFSCLWDDANREYRVALVPKSGYEPIARYPFRRWLPPREEVLYVLRKHE
jgi:hypothetical protein